MITKNYRLISRFPFLSKEFLFLLYFLFSLLCNVVLYKTNKPSPVAKF